MLCVYLIIRLFYLMCDVIDRHDMYTHVISSVLRTERIFRSNDSDSARVLVIGQRRGWRPGRGLSSANPTYFPNRGNGAEIHFLRVSYQYSLGGGGREAARSGEQGVSHVGPERPYVLYGGHTVYVLYGYDVVCVSYNATLLFNV